MNHLTELLLTGCGSGVATSAVIVGAMNLLGVTGKTKADRTTSRETLADGATKTALDALKQALEMQEKAIGTLREDHERETCKLSKDAEKLGADVEAEKGKRVDTEARWAEAQQNVEMLQISVNALAERIQEQDRELADQPKLKTENARLRRQVSELQKQVSDLKARIAGLEQDRAERVTLETEMLLAQTLGAHDADLSPDRDLSQGTDTIPSTDRISTESAKSERDN